MSDAEKIAREIVYGQPVSPLRAIEQALLAAEARGYAKAREQAAVVADKVMRDNEGADFGYRTQREADRMEAAMAIAKAIRKMEPQSPTPNPRTQPVTTAVRLSHTQGGPDEALDAAPTETPGEGLAA